MENFERALASTHTEPRVLIIRRKRVPFIDITGLQPLEEVVRDLKRRHVRVMLTEANARVSAKLEKAGVFELLDRADVFPELRPALGAAGISVE